MVGLTYTLKGDMIDSTFFDWKQCIKRLDRLWALEHTLFICNANFKLLLKWHPDQQHLKQTEST